MKRVLLLLLLPFAVLADTPQEPGTRDGETHTHKDTFYVWDAGGEQWLSPNEFWAAYAERARGKNWGTGDRFPPYDDAGEHDVFLLETEKGACLMYFFHRRWRRANDVRRWDPLFTHHEGCPFVFDRDRF